LKTYSYEANIYLNPIPLEDLYKNSVAFLAGSINYKHKKAALIKLVQPWLQAKKQTFKNKVWDQNKK